MYPMEYNKIMKYVIKQTEIFAKWMAEINDFKAQVRIAARLEAARNGNFGDWKPIEAGLMEMRIDYGPGYRLYYGQVGRIIFLIVGGGIKRTQKRDIKTMLSLWKEIKGDYDE